MEEAYRIAAVWLALVVGASILAYHLRVSIALLEICIGIAAGVVAEHFFGPGSLGSQVDWLKFLAGAGAVLLTFLAGAELEPTVLRAKWKEVTVVGLVGFLAPFIGCAAPAKYALGWAPWLFGGIGIAAATGIARRSRDEKDIDKREREIEADLPALAEIRDRLMIIKGDVEDSALV